MKKSTIEYEYNIIYEFYHIKLEDIWNNNSLYEFYDILKEINPKELPIQETKIIYQNIMKKNISSLITKECLNDIIIEFKNNYNKDNNEKYIILLLNILNELCKNPAHIYYILYDNQLLTYISDLLLILISKYTEYMENFNDKHIIYVKKSIILILDLIKKLFNPMNYYINHKYTEEITNWILNDHLKNIQIQLDLPQILLDLFILCNIDDVLDDNLSHVTNTTTISSTNNQLLNEIIPNQVSVLSSSIDHNNEITLSLLNNNDTSALHTTNTIENLWPNNIDPIQISLLYHILDTISSILSSIPNTWLTYFNNHHILIQLMIIIKKSLNKQENTIDYQYDIYFLVLKIISSGYIININQESIDIISHQTKAFIIWCLLTFDQRYESIDRYNSVINQLNNKFNPKDNIINVALYEYQYYQSCNTISIYPIIKSLISIHIQNLLHMLHNLLIENFKQQLDNNSSHQNIQVIQSDFIIQTMYELVSFNFQQYFLIFLEIILQNISINNDQYLHYITTLLDDINLLDSSYFYLNTDAITINANIDDTMTQYIQFYTLNIYAKIIQTSSNKQLLIEKFIVFYQKNIKQNNLIINQCITHVIKHQSLSSLHFIQLFDLIILQLISFINTTTTSDEITNDDVLYAISLLRILYYLTINREVEIMMYCTIYIDILYAFIMLYSDNNVQHYALYLLTRLMISYSYTNDDENDDQLQVTLYQHMNNYKLDTINNGISLLSSSSSSDIDLKSRKIQLYQLYIKILIENINVNTCVILLHGIEQLCGWQTYNEINHQHHQYNYYENQLLLEQLNIFNVLYQLISNRYIIQINISIRCKIIVVYTALLHKNVQNEINFRRKIGFTILGRKIFLNIIKQHDLLSLYDSLFSLLLCKTDIFIKKKKVIKDNDQPKLKITTDNK